MFSARRLNDGMGAYVAEQTIKCMNKKGVIVKNAKILILGITFKENCLIFVIRRSWIFIITFKEYTENITIYDPWANPRAVEHEYGIKIVSSLAEKEKFDAVILGVAHAEFLSLNVKSLIKDGA